MSIVATCALVAFADGASVVDVAPVITPLFTAHAIASDAHEATLVLSVYALRSAV